MSTWYRDTAPETKSKKLRFKEEPWLAFAKHLNIFKGDYGT